MQLVEQAAVLAVSRFGALVCFGCFLVLSLTSTVIAVAEIDADFIQACQCPARMYAYQLICKTLGEGI